MKMLVEVPVDYEETYKYFTHKGSHVLALLYIQFTTDTELGAAKINDPKREKVECNLTFTGFLVLHCLLKDDSKGSVRMLNESSYRVVMITGNNPLTAAHVACEVEIVDRDVLILDAPEDIMRLAKSLSGRVLTKSASMLTLPSLLIPRISRPWTSALPVMLSPKLRIRPDGSQFSVIPGSTHVSPPSRKKILSSVSRTWATTPSWLATAPTTLAR